MSQGIKTREQRFDYNYETYIIRKKTLQQMIMPEQEREKYLNLLEIIHFQEKMALAYRYADKKLAGEIKAELVKYSAYNAHMRRLYLEVVFPPFRWAVERLRKIKKHRRSK